MDCCASRSLGKGLNSHSQTYHVCRVKWETKNTDSWALAQT